ncbi:MAG: hypothetical protein ACTHN9_07235 [Trinickia sp.]
MVQDIDATAHFVAIDPRQGTLLGFERPADAAEALIASEGTVGGIEPASAPAAASIGRARSKPAVTEQPNAGAELDLTGMPAVAEAETATGLELASPVAVEEAVAAEKAAVEKAAAEKAAAEKAVAEKAAAEKTAAEKAAAEKVVAEKVVAEKAAAEKTAAEKVAAPPPDLAQTVASLQEALLQERSAAQERWRRTRHWLALGLAGLVLLFAVSVAQTVALIGFAHRAQAAQQQTQSTLNDQQAALTGLASSTSALAARMASSALTGSVLDTPFEAHLSPRPAKRVKLVHARHPKDKEKAKLATR